MFVLAKRNLIIPGAPGVKPVVLKKDGFAAVPDWAAETRYFKELVGDGKIIITGTSDKAEQTAAEKKVRTRRPAASDSSADVPKV